MITANAAAIHYQLSEAGGEIKLIIDVPPVFNDRLSLEQIVGNLFDNAVKYRSKVRPLRIDVRTRRMPDDGVRIEVADNGRGIAEAVLQARYSNCSGAPARRISPAKVSGLPMCSR